MTYETLSIKDRISGNPYVGRGIVIGKSQDGEKAVFAYFIMGRSENSRNRVFVENGDEITIYPYDPSKVEDPTLIIYSPIKKVKNDIIVTNGDQTDTVEEFLNKGGDFRSALRTRAFEPDAPNFTPRISGILHFDNGFTYEMSILKSANENGDACNRYFYEYESLDGIGHFIHTYVTDGNPLPTFMGEPERVSIPNDIDEFASDIWNNLDKNNKIALHVRYVDLKTSEVESVTYNVHEVL